jgi:hypothetical protein
VILGAAAAQGAKGVEIRLRWSFQDGWLPDGGYNLYRTDGTGPISGLNRSPLGGTLATNAPAQIQVGAHHALQLKSLLAKAAAPQGSTLPPITTSVSRAASSATQFTQLAGQAKQLHFLPSPSGAIPTPSATGVDTVPSAAKAAPRPAVTPPSLADTAIAARRTLLLAAALNPDAGAALGLQFDDSTVTPGRTYTYTLRQVVGGKESGDLASVAVTVPTSSAALKPAAPTGVQAAQLGADSVGLRWDRLSAFTERLMGVARYDVYRNSVPDNMAGFQPGTNSGLGRKLNDIPVLVTDNLAAGSGPAPAGAGGTSGTIEAATFFNDTSPPTASVTYDVTVTDIFGRTSDPAQIVFAVQDWHKPLPVPFASGQLQPNPAAASQTAAYKQARRQQYRRAAPFIKIALTIQPPAQQVLVVWTPSFQDPRLNTIWESNRPPDTGVVYNVYRVDTEQPNATPTLLTSTPVSSAPIPAVQLPAGQASDALAHQACLNIAGNSTTLQGACTNLNDDFRHTLLSAMSVYTFADSGVTKDHYYRYFVAAVFSRNSQAATPTRTDIVAYPNLTPPAAATNLTTAFQAAATTQSTAASQTGNCGKLQLATTCHPLALPTSDSKPLTLTDWKGPITKASPRDMGGTMVVKWTASHDAARYEIYRANALHGKAPNLTVCSWFTCQSMVAVDWQALRDPDGVASASGPALADSDFALLGTTTQPEYDDQLSRSSAHYYVYRVVPVNRWNVPGPLLSISARAPATMNPTSAKLLAGTPAPDGGAQVEFTPVADAGEEVVRYELWRVNLTNASLTPATAGNGSSNNSSSAAGNASSAPAAGSTSGAVGGAGSSGLAASVAGGARLAPASSLSSVLATPAPLGLAGAAARYGVTVHQPLLSAAARSGVGMSRVAQLQNPAGGLSATVTKIATVGATTVTNGSGVWVSDAASSVSWRNDYAYWVRTVDQDGLQSDSEPVDITPFKVKASAPGNPASQWDQAKCAVDLSWTVTDAETAGFVLERLTGNDNYLQISGITSATTSQYSDYTVFPDNSYLYRVRTVDKAGNVSVAAVVPTRVAVPDTCSGTTTARHVKNSPPAAADAATATTPSVPANSAPEPADEITIPATRSNGPTAPGTQSGDSSSTPTPSAPSTTAPKPLDDIEIPATKPK